MENFNYNSVPFNYLHCLNPACSRSSNCLHHLAAQHVPAEVARIMAVNPANYPSEAERCIYFRSTEKQRYAWGISALFDNIPYKKAIYLKREIHDLYPRTTYDRLLHQERGLSPAEQERISGLFTQIGIGEAPAFDRYTEEYEWDEQHTPKGCVAP